MALTKRAQLVAVRGAGETIFYTEFTVSLGSLGLGFLEH